MNTPTLDKISAVRPKAEVLGPFIEWLGGQGIHLAKFHEHNDECVADECTRSEEFLFPYVISPSNLIAMYLGIDLQEADREKNAILESLRAAS